MPITPLDNDEPFARRLTHDPATMVGALAWAAALFALGGVAIVAFFPWDGSLSENWRGSLLFATLLPAYFIAGAAVCVAAASVVRLLQHLRAALAPDVRRLRATVRAMRRADGSGLR